MSSRYPEIFFWEPLVSPHKLELYTALLDTGLVGCVHQIADKPLEDDRERIDMGWSATIPDAIPTHIAPSQHHIDRIVEHSNPASIHIFSGIHWVPSLVNGIDAAIRHKRHFVIMSEPRVLEGFKGWGRLLHSWLTERRIRRHCDAVLAIGRNGPDWFRMAGYKAENIFPYAYFVGHSVNSQRLRETDAPCIGYLGRLTHAKGFSAFCQAIERLDIPVHVDIAGAGPLRGLAQALVGTAPQRIRFRGPIPITQVHDFLAGIDILIVPSQTKDDGWGVVINEALFSGVPVITSTQTGASVCVETLQRGRILKRATPDKIVEAIKSILNETALDENARAERAAWANTHVSAANGARYLLDILGCVYSNEKVPRPFYAS